MTVGAAVDDKRADERRIKELRDFQRSNPGNKRCFDCNEMMPQYVCVDFNTFVCTSCSGIHREFGHRVKSISMSKFTDTEVKNMLKFGGNEAAQKIWRAKHDASFRPSGGTDGERTRNFIRLTYIDKKWQYESPRPSAREDQPQSRTASGGAKKATTTSGDDFFSSSSSSKAAPTFDAFGDPTPSSNNGGFAAFGDFSNFDKPKKQQNDFDDFGRFDSPTSTSSQSTSGFGDFGAFASKPSAAPPLRDEFKTGSFTLAPPPGSDFGGFGAPPPPVAVPAPVAQTKTTSGGNDFLAFSPVNNKPATDDPFGFANSPVASTKTNSQKAATPFDAFGSPISANTSRSSFDAFGAPGSTGSRSGSSSFDAFGAAAPSTPATAFDAFGSTSTPSPSASTLDAFGAASTTTPASPGFGAFGAPSPAFDAFGASPVAAKTSSGSAFGAFGSSAGQGATSFDAFGSVASPAASGFSGFGASTGNSSSRTNSATPSDAFGGFSPRTSSGTSAQEKPKAAAADPFSAFDSVESSGLSSVPAPLGSGLSGSAHDAFGGAQTVSAQSVGHVPSPFGQAQGQNNAASNADPFVFAGASANTGSFSSNGIAAPSKTNSFSTVTPGSQPGFGVPNAFGGFPQGPQPGAFGQPSSQGQSLPPQNHLQFQQQQQMHNQQTGQFGQFPTQGYAGQPGLQPQQQQQQWGQPPTGSFGGQFQPQHGHSNQTATNAHSTPSQPPPNAPVAPKADVSSLNDPFASLGLGNLGMGSNAAASNSNPSSRGNSFAKPTGSPAISAASSFTKAAPTHPTSGHPPLGANLGFGMGSTPLSSGGSRGNSFEAPKSHFAASTGSSSPSPMASFSVPAMGAPTSTPPFGASSPSPMASFSFPGAQATPQKQNSFGDANAFGAFPSPARADSMKQHAPPASSSNPFDMF